MNLDFVDINFEDIKSNINLNRTGKMKKGKISIDNSYST